MKQINVKLVRSRIGTTPHQRKCLDALGLRKMQKVKTFKATPAIMGIVRQVPHLVEVTVVKEQSKPVKAEVKNAAA